jgi:Rod binding domain-containing protein
MDSISRLSSTFALDSATNTGAPPTKTKEQIASAAKQFESLMMQQLLKSASGGNGGWMGTGEEDSSGLQAMDIAHEQLASALAAHGGFGLAKFIIPQLTQQSNAQSAPQPTADELPKQDIITHK